MRALLPAIAAMAASLAAFAAGIAAGDRQLFVPPPESVAENFVRQLATHRYDRARVLLSADAAARHDLADLAAFARRLEETVGAIELVEGKSGSLTTETAHASARVQGVSRRETTIPFELVMGHGLWKIDVWPSVNSTARELRPPPFQSTCAPQECRVIVRC